ncbi:MAG: tyrosine-type recombinase/integrase [Oscillospiraceae bacterium]|jgi:site-specific recombinase XerD|nr:tyrosine-type recombinase/integrase [Oscillospiraceae bacterium]
MRREELAELPKAARDYCNYLLAVRNRSPLTVLEYAGDLRTFFRWLCQNRRLLEDKNTPWEKIPLDALTVEILGSVELYEVYEFLAYCADIRKNSPKSRARKVVSLRRFYRYMLTQKLLSSNPLEHLEAPEFKPALPHYLTLSESRELLAAVDSRHKERDTAILTLFLHCGLRLAELVGINLNDIHDGKLTVTGKGDKQRIVYLNAACEKAIADYMPMRNKIPGALDMDALFISGQKNRIGRGAVQHVVYTMLEKAGLNQPGMSSHKLRHTAATLLYQHGGVDVRTLQELLGHVNLGTTQIYTHVSNEQLRTAQESNPLLKENEQV